MKQGDLFDDQLPPPVNELEAKFREFHENNPRVYELVKRFTFQAINAGRRRFGIGMIWERIRWYSEIETKGDEEFKLCNDHRAYYARMFMRDYPEYGGFFVTKRVKGEEQIDEESEEL